MACQPFSGGNPHSDPARYTHDVMVRFPNWIGYNMFCAAIGIAPRHLSYRAIEE